MKNTLVDLNNHLFEQLERLNDEDLTADELDREIRRADAITSVAKTIIDNADISFKVIKLQADQGKIIEQLPPMLGNKE